ncbi:hypothetical protein WR25_00305 [Diploscapter pachys]|uniref:Uncharacterized protein n=1 Tax=Diploscapter pachys TaxID=2018661 RepID=A0A2A2J712_9BILA|nr:hypothetical protein WR25_00305 [Diploscapter pachys]
MLATRRKSVVIRTNERTGGWNAVDPPRVVIRHIGLSALGFISMITLTHSVRIRPIQVDDLKRDVNNPPTFLCPGIPRTTGKAPNSSQCELSPKFKMSIGQAHMTSVARLTTPVIRINEAFRYSAQCPLPAVAFSVIPVMPSKMYETAK